MPRPARSLAFMLVCGLALLCTACGSNNKGKIEGKWKIVEFGGADAKAKADFEQMTKMGLYVYLDFKPDGNLVMAIGADDPTMLDLIKKMAPPGTKTEWSAKYKLLSGDKVEVYDIKDDELKKAFKGDKGRSEVKINGDDMTIKDPDGSVGKLVRLKDKPAGDSKAK